MQNRRVAVRGIILKNGKILAVRLNKYKGRATDDDQDYWCMPGGGVDVGEPLIPALEREMVEETGIKPVVGNLLCIQQFEHKECEHLEFFFHITNTDDYEKIDLDKTTHGAIEIAEVGFINPAESTLLPVFLTKHDLVAVVEQGVTRIFNNLA